MCRDLISLQSLGFPFPIFLFTLSSIFQPHLYTWIFLNISSTFSNVHAFLKLFPPFFPALPFLVSFSCLCLLNFYPSFKVQYKYHFHEAFFFFWPHCHSNSLFSGFRKHFVSISVMSYNVTWFPNVIPRSLKSREDCV